MFYVNIVSTDDQHEVRISVRYAFNEEMGQRDFADLLQKAWLRWRRTGPNAKLN